MRFAYFGCVDLMFSFKLVPLVISSLCFLPHRQTQCSLAGLLRRMKSSVRRCSSGCIDVGEANEWQFLTDCLWEMFVREWQAFCKYHSLDSVLARTYTLWAIDFVVTPPALLRIMYYGPYNIQCGPILWTSFSTTWGTNEWMKFKFYSLKIIRNTKSPSNTCS